MNRSRRSSKGTDWCEAGLTRRRERSGRWVKEVVGGVYECGSVSVMACEHRCECVYPRVSVCVLERERKEVRCLELRITGLLRQQPGSSFL